MFHRFKFSGEIFILTLLEHINHSYFRSVSGSLDIYITLTPLFLFITFSPLSLYAR